MSNVIGIDLGTANSCVAILKDGQVIVIPDKDGNRTMPSVVAINANQEPIVGHAGMKQADANRLNTIFAVKRLIGRKFTSTEVAEFSERIPYKVVPASNNDAWVEINGTPTSPEQISAHILKQLRDVAETYLGEPVNHAVITVPAHFNDSQRQATKDAGKVAGLQVLSIINEPTAAALAYGLDIATDAESSRSDGSTATHKKEAADRIIAVYDLGSGTFDVTILQLKNGVFDVLATGGDTYLGGEDFDLAIVDHLLSEFKKIHQVDLSKDRSVLQRLKEAAKTAKQELSYAYQFEVALPYIAQGSGTAAPKDLKVTLDRKTFERLVAPLLDRLEEPCLQAMEDAKLRPEDIHDVILVGGMTRMPAVKQRCQKLFNKKPIDSINPDEAVASGAAIQAGLLQGILQGMRLADVTSLSLGLETQGGKMVTLIPRNSKIPTKVTELFTTSAPNQTSVSIHVLQGESSFVPDNKSLGRFELGGVKLAPRGKPRIEVSLEVDGDGIVHVSAKDQDTGEQKEIEIINSSGLSDDEINQLVNDNRRQAAQKARLAQRHAQLARLEKGKESEFAPPPQNEVEVMQDYLKGAIFETQFKLDMEAKKFRGERRARIQECLDQARIVLDTKTDVAELMECLKSVQTAAEELESYLEAA